MRRKKNSLRALLLDFDGVLADTEPVHLRMFQEVLHEEGIDLNRSDYYTRYLGLDDRSCFEALFRDRGKELTPERREELVRRKNRSVLGFVGGRSLLLPGVAGFLEAVSKKQYLAVVSGALRSEVMAVLSGAGVEGRFHVIVAAEDVTRGKPDPEGFLTALRLLNRDAVPPSEILLASECLVVEDSPWGIEAARRAGMKCLALLTSYPAEPLKGADRIAPDLPSADWREIERLFVAS